MSTVAVSQKGHRHTRSVALPSPPAPSQNPQNPHHLNLQAHVQNRESEMNYPLQQPSTPPRTPRRADQLQSSSQNSISSATPDNCSKHRSRNKNRPKNVMTSPVATRNDRNTPPLTGAQSASRAISSRPISTPSTAAYAGPTFHASPAPSALPIPSFYSKSVPDSPGIKELKTLKGDSSSNVNNSHTPPAPQPSNNYFKHEESPLDFFFKADREEKARARSASSTQPNFTMNGPFQPPPESPSNSHTPPTSGSQTGSRQVHADRGSSSAIFAMELDGPSSPGTPYGPAFSTPYSERINAARTVTSVTRPDNTCAQESQPSRDRSEALKAYLFSGQTLQSPAAPSSSASHALMTASPQTPTSAIAYQNNPTTVRVPRNAVVNPRAQQNSSLFSNDLKTLNANRASGRTSGLRQEVTPTRTPRTTPDRNVNYRNSPTPSQIYGKATPKASNDFNSTFNSHTASPSPASSCGVSAGTRSADLQGMEDSLRKLLKLDSAGSSGISRSGLGSIPATAVSVSGRPSPLDGMHNGVMGS